MDMNREQQRQQSQLDFVASGQEIVVGNEALLPLPLAQLRQTTADSAYVVETFAGGLTAHVYHIRVDGKDWNLKLKRPESLVKNVDGQTSFLNEVQRRRDFQQLKNQAATSKAFAHVVPTVYASFQHGVMLSPWIEGNLLTEFNEVVLTQLFDTVVNFELQGIIEWDLCPGNILFDGHDISLFDFGYCYTFDPLSEFNSCGLDAPLFHSVERLETRNFFGYLLKKESTWSQREIMSLFELEKRLALQAYQRKYAALKKAGAQQQVLDWVQGFVQRWQQALSTPSALDDLFLVESFRSHLLDVNDDLHGQSCTPMTLQRLDRVEQVLTDHFDALKKLDGLFFGDELLTQQALLSRTTEQRRQAKAFQLQ
ncbi:hypothetical protein DU002_05540 [Corallincola holothuriorum]|uniref:Phosphotransferase n=2 Tax=Corallincola holothuriorum TaxID=2282215 RepID=A0A368NMX6_9GAMM|nr:hypothetical protein DU002_05540 [Corallincola holothuriorum]